VICDADCTLAICGDGTLNITAGEQCDDGDNNNGDGCDENCNNEALALAPLNQFNIGDSIGEGEAADGTIGEAHHDKVWSTGYDVNDIVYSLNERFEDADPVYYGENSVTMDAKYNKAISGAVMSDFVNQANNVVAEATAMGGSGMVTILLGNNDVCESSLDSMTDPVLFESQYRSGLDVLAASPYTKDAEIHVSSIPDIYWLWVAKKDSGGCRFIWWIGGVCQALLQNPGDDCESVASRDDPDTDYPEDGPNCKRRKDFHRRIQGVYNPILKNVLDEYINNGKLPNAYFVDIFDVKFTSLEVNNGDCFHPSTAGHKILADEEWCKSLWSIGDPLCTP
jgi:cysteine-rich repeat protein